MFHDEMLVEKRLTIINTVVCKPQEKWFCSLNHISILLISCPGKLGVWAWWFVSNIVITKIVRVSHILKHMIVRPFKVFVYRVIKIRIFILIFITISIMFFNLHMHRFY